MLATMIAQTVIAGLNDIYSGLLNITRSEKKLYLILSNVLFKENSV